jgi:hypothetical protein
MERLSNEFNVKKSGNAFYFAIPKELEKNFEYDDGIKYELILTLIELDEKGFLTDKIKNLRLISRITGIGFKKGILIPRDEYNKLELEQNKKYRVNMAYQKLNLYGFPYITRTEGIDLSKEYSGYNKLSFDHSTY